MLLISITSLLDCEPPEDRDLVRFVHHTRLTAVATIYYRLREVQQLAQDHTASEKAEVGLNPGSLVLGPYFFKNYY